MIDPQAYLTEALIWIKESRTLILDSIQQGFQIEKKMDSTYVTTVDREVEKLLRTRISNQFPEHGIIAEEFAEQDSHSDFQWYIDPIDGTLSFSRNIPLFGTLLALYYQEQPLISVIDMPGLDKCYYAALNQGAFCNQQLIQRSAHEDLSEDILGVSDRAQFEKVNQTPFFDHLLQNHPYVRTYPDCFGHVLAISGSIGAIVDFGLNIWDIAPTRLLIQESGGKYCEFKHGQKYGVICGKQAVVDWLVEEYKTFG